MSVPGADGQLVGGLVAVGLLAILGARARLVRTTRALGLEQLLASGFLFVPIGMALSEAGLGVIAGGVARQFDALVTLALAVIGLLLGLRIDLRAHARSSRFTRAVAVEFAVTLLLVAIPCALLLEVAGGAGAGQRLDAAALLGCAAAISGGHPFQAAAMRVSWRAVFVVSRLADAGTVAGILAAGAFVALLGPAGGLAGAERLLALAAIGAMGGLAAWLLAREAHDGLRIVLLLGVLLVTAGTAAHLALPPVAATLLSGIVIANLPGAPAAELREALEFLENPMTVLLLIVGGAALQMPPLPVLLVVPVFVGLRAAGKVLGGALAARVSGGGLPHNIGLGLLPSRALALGLALDFQASAGGPLGSSVVFVAVVGSLLSETAGIWTARLLARSVGLRQALLEAPAESRS